MIPQLDQSPLKFLGVFNGVCSGGSGSFRNIASFDRRSGEALRRAHRGRRRLARGARERMPGSARPQRRRKIHGDSRHCRPRYPRLRQHHPLRCTRRLVGGTRVSRLGSAGIGHLSTPHLPRKPHRLRPLSRSGRQAVGRVGRLVPRLGRVCRIARRTSPASSPVA